MVDRSTLWVGRVRVADERRHRTVRIFTDGAAPGPDDAVEEIADPFVLALPSEGGSAEAHAAVLARELPRVAALGPLGALELAPPLRPGKIICVGRNYRAHAEEMGNEVPAEPLLFFKPSSSLLASGQPIVLPSGFERIDMEAELVAVIGRVGRHPGTRGDDPLALVAGYTLGNDVSNRDLQQRDKQWTRAKGFDGFAPCGPFIRMVQGSTGHPPGHARIRGWLGDELRQDAPLHDMIFDLAAVLAYVGRCMTLEPGDLVYTGTPAGVSQLLPGGSCAVELEGWTLGRLVNPLVAEEPIPAS